MNLPESTKHNIAYKWISCFVLICFVYYWLLTLGLIFFNKPVREAIPRQTSFYHVFWHQRWELFAHTNLYTRKLNLIIREKSDTSKTDTTDLVQYCIAQKRKYAPFNSYSDAVDHLLFLIITDLAAQVAKEKTLLRGQSPGGAEDSYMQQASARVENDSLHHDNLQNLVNYGKYVLEQKQINMQGKEFKLVLTYNYIPPQKPPVDINGRNTGTQTIFVSSYKTF